MIKTFCNWTPHLARGSYSLEHVTCSSGMKQVAVIYQLRLLHITGNASDQAAQKMHISMLLK